MNKTICVCLICALLCGCSVIEWFRPDPIVKVKTVEVKIPVYLKPDPPFELIKPQKFDLPAFQGPAVQGSSSCLNGQGEAKLKRMLIILHDRDNAWREWAK